MNTSRIALYGEWILANCVAELLGLGATFAIGVGLFSGLADTPGIGASLLSAGLMTATGVLEGAVVGFAQWLVLRDAVPGITRRAWVLATILGALIAWFLASLSMSLASLSQPPAPTTASEPPQSLVLLVAAGMGLGAGFVLSITQWRVLRKYVDKAWLWLPANALAWAAGMPLIFAAVDLAQRTGSIAGGVLVMAAGIALAGAIVGAIHGIALLYFQRSRFEMK
jgi:hypothetical protein